jgi:hypothetical protein
VAAPSSGGGPYWNSPRRPTRKHNLALPTFDHAAEEDEILALALYELMKD